MVVFQADSLAAAVGVNVHAASPPYSRDPARFASALRALGVRHVRDEILEDGARAQSALVAAVPGLRFNLVASPLFCTPTDVVARIRALGAGNVSSVEGQNEGDSPWARTQPGLGEAWAARVAAYQAALYEEVKNAFPDLLVISPTVLDYRPADMGAIRAAASFCDAVAIHAYNQEETEPESASPYASLSWYLTTFQGRWKPDAPVLFTECGYTTPPGGRVTPEAAGKYIPRLLLHSLRLGVRRAFLYELMDEGTDRDTENHWGLVLPDGSPKPAYVSTQNLLALLADPGAPFAPAPMAVSLIGAPATVQGVVFQRRDRSYQVALWNAVASGPEAAPPFPVRFATSRPFRAVSYAVANVGRAYASVATDEWMATVPVSDAVTVVHLVP